MSDDTANVAIIGAGDIGRGWAALFVAAGWKVSLYDNDSSLLESAQPEIERRAKTLVMLKHADAESAERGFNQLHMGRSLLDGCRDANWIIEAIAEDTKAKQKLVEGLESAAPEAEVVSSSATAMSVHDMVARAQRPERCLVVHPMNPPELIPLVEMVQGEGTDPAVVEKTRTWLRQVGRIPVLLKKPVLGNIVTRISAAVWREAIDLVINGVIDVDDFDRAVSLGPALGWAAAGPHLSHNLAAGNQPVAGFFQHLLHTYQDIWEDLADWSHLDPQQEHTLIHKVDAAYKDNLPAIRDARDRRLAGILQGMDRARNR
ncbi:MAG: 3-hydroxyacyl-CoA dehydrogenase NAD-binding domain-containing protein [Gemmatimonadota bacterium]|nr:3-hydroxyacyl-CoA dehydrogenase NAD-binding domain-containing protein [Gemmatimonadota bacterium]